MEDAYARSIAEVLDFFGVDPMKGLSDSQDSSLETFFMDNLWSSEWCCLSKGTRKQR
ncbi:hypothetical protein NC651_006033 [Populus alba x Populus x berolinensis]|nr:hypothetical protein NC651_006033 [Populus alba x Populus x berolinensis]